MGLPDSLVKLYSDLGQYYSNMHSQMKVEKSMYRREYSEIVSIPDEVFIHESSTTSQIVDILRDQIATDQPVVEYVGRGTSTTSLKHKSLMELFGRYFMREIAYQSGVDPFYHAVGDLIWLGAGCIKYVTRLDKVPDVPDPPTKSSIRLWEADVASAWPYTIRAVDPMSVLPEPGLEPSYFLEVQDRYVADIISRYPTWADPMGRRESNTPTTQWLEYWSDEHHIVEVDGQRIVEQRNVFGAPPYAWSYSGMGRLDRDGDPSFLAQSVIANIMGELQDEVRIKTAHSAQWQFHVFPRLLTTEDEKKVRKQFMKGPGSVIRHAPGAEPKWLDTPPPNPQMLQFLQLVQANIFRRVGVALSQRPEGVEAGIHQALLIGQALKVLRPIRSSLDKLASMVLNGLARQIYVLHLPVNVRGHLDKEEVERMVKPDALARQAFKVRFEAVDPAENDRRMLAGLAVLRGAGSPLMSGKTFRDKYMKGVIEDGEEEEARILAEGVVQRFVMSGALDQMVVQEILRGDQAEQLAAATSGAVEELQNVVGARRRNVERVTSGQAVVEEEVGQAGQVSAIGGIGG